MSEWTKLLLTVAILANLGKQGCDTTPIHLMHNRERIHWQEGAMLARHGAEWYALALQKDLEVLTWEKGNERRNQAAVGNYGPARQPHCGSTGAFAAGDDCGAEWACAVGKSRDFAESGLGGKCAREHQRGGAPRGHNRNAAHGEERLANC